MACVISLLRSNGDSLTSAIIQWCQQALAHLLLSDAKASPTVFRHPLGD